MAKLRLGTTYWLDRFTGRAARYPTLAGRHHVDVAIVGGGITGCLAAHAFLTAGFRVLVLERNRIGRGSTAASTALLMQEPDVDFRDLAERYGTKRSRTIWKQSASSVQGLVALIRQLRIDAALQMVPSVYFTSDGAIARFYSANCSVVSARESEAAGCRLRRSSSRPASTEPGPF